MALSMPRRRRMAFMRMRRPLREYLVDAVKSLSDLGLKFEVSSFGPRAYYIFRKLGGSRRRHHHSDR